LAEKDVTSSPGSIIRMEDTLKAILPEGKFSGPLPPVEAWNPARSSDIGMEIRADGRWWHEGGEIKRERLVKLFSRILRRDEDGSTWLVTPYEKVIVHVADAPFLAVRVDRTGPPGPDQALTFTTSLGDVTHAGPGAPIRVETDPGTGEPAPYVLVRGRLEAKIARPVFYELVDMAEPDPGGRGLLGVWSQGQFFVLGPAA
jgi:hypothetical protein